MKTEIEEQAAVEKIREFAKAGWTQEKMEAELHVDHETISYLLAKYNVEDNRGKKNCDIPQHLLERWDRLHRKYGTNVERK